MALRRKSALLATAAAADESYRRSHSSTRAAVGPASMTNTGGQGRTWGRIVNPISGVTQVAKDR